MTNELDSAVADHMTAGLTVDQASRFLMGLAARLGKVHLSSLLREVWQPGWEAGPVLGFATVYLLTVCDKVGTDRVLMLIDTAKPGPGD